MEILLWILFGIMSGWIASVILETKDRYSLFKDVLLGVLGAVAAGLTTNLLGYHGISSYNALSVVTATIFVMLLIGMKHALEPKHMKSFSK